MKTRIISALLCMIMVLSMIPFAASATEPLTLTVSDFEAELAGLENFEVTITLANNPGVAMVGFDISYDDTAMTLKEVVNGEVYDASKLSSSNINAVPYAFYAMDDSANVTGDGVLITLKFDVKEGAATGEYAIELQNPEVYNIDEDVIETAVTAGTVKYKDAPITGVTLEDNAVEYDGTAKTLELVGTLPEGATVTWSNENNPAVNAGEYEITATIEATGYETLALTATLTITPKLITLTDLVAADKEYDGTTAVNVTYTAMTGVLDGDVLAIDDLGAAFEDKNAGENKAVLINPTFSGAAAGNYAIDATALTATITPKAITLDAVDGDAKTAAFTGVAGGDDLALNFNNVAFEVGDNSTNAVIDPNADVLSGNDAANYVLSNTGANGLVTVGATVSQSNLVKVDVTFAGDTAAVLNIANGSYFIKGSIITLIATSSKSNAYNFTGWYDGSTRIYKDAEYTFTIDADTALTAKFSKKNTNNVASVAPSVLPGIQEDKKPSSKPTAIPSAKTIEIELTIDSKTIVKNGTKYDLDVPAQIVNNRTLVPLRAIFEALGATVEWDEATRTVTSTKGGTTVKLTIDDNKLYVNGVTRELDVPAQIIESRTMVPTRAIAEAFGCSVEWNEGTRTVVIKN